MHARAAKHASFVSQTQDAAARSGRRCVAGQMRHRKSSGLCAVASRVASHAAAHGGECKIPRIQTPSTSEFVRVRTRSVWTLPRAGRLTHYILRGILNGQPWGRAAVWCVGRLCSQMPPNDFRRPVVVLLMVAGVAALAVTALQGRSTTLITPPPLRRLLRPSPQHLLQHLHRRQLACRRAAHRHRRRHHFRRRALHFHQRSLPRRRRRPLHRRRRHRLLYRRRRRRQPPRRRRH